MQNCLWIRFLRLWLLFLLEDIKSRREVERFGFAVADIHRFRHLNVDFLSFGPCSSVRLILHICRDPQKSFVLGLQFLKFVVHLLGYRWGSICGTIRGFSIRRHLVAAYEWSLYLLSSALLVDRLCSCVCWIAPLSLASFYTYLNCLTFFCVSRSGLTDWMCPKSSRTWFFCLMESPCRMKTSG